MSSRAALALVALALLLPLAPAQEATPVLVERVDPDGALVANVGAPAVARFELFNLNPREDFFVRVDVDDVRDWAASIDQERFFVGPRNTTVVTVSFEPLDVPRSSASFGVTFTLVDGSTGEVTRVTETLLVGSGAPPRVFGAFVNPLAAPLDNAYGSFLLEMLAWLAIAGLAVLALDMVVRLLTTRADAIVTRDILAKLRKPTFYFVLLLGLSRAFRLIPDNVVSDFVSRFLLAIAVGVFGLYVLYRTLDAGLYYYQKELARRTSTEVDDIIVPVIRKVGLVAVYVIGIVMSLRVLGWDPTIVFAGAGIAGLVIAFAAQDTFSNLFSGVFLMVDRPFVEGDDIQLESGDTARVMSVGLRTTRLHNYQTYEDIIVPNNQLATKRIINHTRPDRRYRISVEVGVAYDSDPEQVRQLLLDAANANPRVAKEPPFAPTIRFSAFGESALVFTLRAVIPDFQQRNEIATELRFDIKRRLDAAGIEIPFPQRTLWIKDGSAAARLTERR